MRERIGLGGSAKLWWKRKPETEEDTKKRSLAKRKDARKNAKSDPNGEPRMKTEKGMQGRVN